MGSLFGMKKNIGGSKSKKREVLNGVHSLLLYGEDKRKVVLRVASACKTTSLKAIQVITATTLIYLEVFERAGLYRRETSRGQRCPRERLALLNGNKSSRILRIKRSGLS